MRIALIIILIPFFIIPISASENLKVELFKDNFSLSLTSYQQISLYGSAVAYLSTCRHLERVTGENINKDSAHKGLIRIKSGNYLRISFSMGTASIPIAHGFQETDYIYIGIDNIGFPAVVTLHEDKIQLYAKCSGEVAIKNFSCNQTLSELLSFNIDADMCKISE